ncbi:MAG: hypothetical protein AABX89_07570 [Candidatus Thermoplasmatota archaeon]
MRRTLPLLAALLLLPAAFAQAPTSEALLTTSFALEEIPASGVTPIDFLFTLDCQTVLTSGGGDVALALEGVPEWLSATAAGGELAPEDCLADPTGVAELALTGGLEPIAGAPGLLPAELTAKATYTSLLGDTVEASAVLPAFHVAYLPGHRLTPEGDQTFQVQSSKPLTVPLRIEVLANARTMVMFEDKTVSNPDALVNGLKAKIFDVPPGQIGLIVEERNVVFTPPTGAWDKVTVSFRNYSHCLDGPDCGNELERVLTWTFVNAAPDQISQVDGAGATESSKGAPAPGLLLVVGAVGVALLLRRRIA